VPLSCSAILLITSEIRRWRLAVSRDVENMQLYIALGKFGSSQRQLDADHLELHKDVLVALFGESILEDPSRRRAAAERVEQLMQQVIRDIPDVARKRAAEVVFASEDRFQQIYVKQRLAAVTSNKEDRAFEETQYKHLREWVLRHMAAELPHALAAAEHVPEDQIMSSAAMRAARQFYRYAQQVIVIVDVFDGCIRYEERLQRDIWGKGVTGGDVNSLKNGWLAAYGTPGKDFRLVPTGPSYSGDQALLPLAYYQRYRQALLAERSARDYLRENLDTYEWERLQTGYPLSTADIDVLVDTLEVTTLDEAWSYVDALDTGEAGQVVQARWASLLSTNAHGELGERNLPHRDFDEQDRKALIAQLLRVCMLFEGFFPDDTHCKYEEYLAVDTVITEALVQAGIQQEGSEGFERERCLEDAIFDRRPARYHLRDDDEPVWVKQDDYRYDDW